MGTDYDKIWRCTKRQPHRRDCSLHQQRDRCSYEVVPPWPHEVQRERDEPQQGVVANTLNLVRLGAFGFIGSLDGGINKQEATLTHSRTKSVTITADTKAATDVTIPN